MNESLTTIPPDDALNALLAGVEGEGPFSVVRIGDGELCVLGGSAFRRVDRSGEWHYYANHVHSSAISWLEGKTADYIRNCDLLGMFAWDEWAREVLEQYRIEVTVPVFYPFDNIGWCHCWQFQKILATKRVALVGGYSEAWTEIIHTAFPTAQISVITPLGPNDCVDRDVDGVPTNSLCCPRRVEDIEEVFRRLRETDFDVCIACYGVWAGVVCDFVKCELGKSAIDYGHGSAWMLWHPEKGYTFEPEALEGHLDA